MRLELEQTASAFVPAKTQMAFGFANQASNDFEQVLANGISAAQSGNRAQARILLQYAVELDRQSEAGWLWLASISEYPEELLIFLDHVLDINPKNSRAAEWKTATNQLMAKTFVQRGIDASKKGENVYAMECFERALSYDEQNQLAWFWKDSLSKDEEHESAKSDSGEVEVEPETHRSLQTILIEAEASMADGDRQQALSLVNEAIDLDSESEKAWTLRSHLVDDFDEKRRSLERVVGINPENETCKAALETLLAMVETVTPDYEEKKEPATERLLNTPFDQVAQPIISDHENSPTQELELPQAILDHNPFVMNENPDVSGEVWVPEPDTKPHADNTISYSDVKYPAIDAPFESTPQIYSLPDSEPLPVQQFENYREDADTPSWSQSYAEPEIESPVHNVSASAYLEEPEHPVEMPPADESYLSGPSWSEESEKSDSEAGHASTWVIDDSVELPEPDADIDPGRTILVVDDSPVVRKLIAGKLQESGYNVLSASSGAEAMAVISSVSPDLILLDIAMPKMDGYQVCENIRKNGSTVPVVLISGKDGLYDEDRAQRAGTSSFISKPFGPETLMRALESYLPSA